MDRIPLGIPSSWYVVAYSDEIPAGEAKRLHYLEREMVAFRGADGAVAVLDAYCPHDGAHLGVGSKVENGTLRCPFHGWRFDATGTCIEIPNASRIPARARTRRWTTLERNGMVFVWYDALDKPPSFEPPDLPEWHDEGFTKSWLHSELTIATHPQEMAQNGVDWQHFPFVHFMGLPREASARFEGPAYFWSFRSGKRHTLQALDEDFLLAGENWGLGYNVTRQTGVFRTVVAVGMTPVDHGTLEVKLGVIAHRGGRGEAELEQALRTYMEEHAVVAKQDLHIWENKIYRPHPVLSEADGPIGEYRHWARQFYPTA